MRQKIRNEGTVGRKVMNEVLDILEERSVKSFELAKRQVLAMDIESQKAREAMEHYVKNWNDFTHPGILSLACESVNGAADEIIPVQVAMLLLTAAMDVHDDIIDQSFIKNGQPTVFGKFGGDIALLLGDALLLEGLMLCYKYSKNVPSEKMIEILGAIEDSFFEVGNAHLLEVDLKGRSDITPSRYLHVLEKKASIIEGHTRIGAIVGGGSEREIEVLADYGKILGALIALREEFIDVFDPEELQTRMRNGCLPLPILYAIENPQAKKPIMKILSKSKISNKDAIGVVDLVFEERAVRRLRDRMQNLAKKATKAVSTLTNKQTKDYLKLLISGALEDL